MSLKIKDKAKPAVPPITPDVYMAACVGVIDLGEQYSDKFKSYSNKVMLTFELLGETVEIDGEEKPRQISKIFAFATGARSGLRKFLGDWDGRQLNDEQAKEEDLSQRLGRTCQIQVVLNETGDKSVIGSIMGVPKGIKLDKPKSEMILFDLDEFDQATFEKLSEWTRETIQKSSQWQKEHASTETVAVSETEDPSSGPAGHLPPRGKALTADPETGEVIEDGGADSSTPLRSEASPLGRSAQNDKGKGGVPF